MTIKMVIDENRSEIVYSGPPGNAGLDGKDIFTVAGLAVDLNRTVALNDKGWLGLNGKYYSLDWWGNQYVGYRSTAIGVANYLDLAANSVFAVSTYLNVTGGIEHAANGNYGATWFAVDKLEVLPAISGNLTDIACSTTGNC